MFIVITAMDSNTFSNIIAKVVAHIISAAAKLLAFLFTIVITSFISTRQDTSWIDHYLSFNDFTVTLYTIIDS